MVLLVTNQNIEYQKPNQKEESTHWIVGILLEVIKSKWLGVFFSRVQWSRHYHKHLEGTCLNNELSFIQLTHFIFMRVCEQDLDP